MMPRFSATKPWWIILVFLSIFVTNRTHILFWDNVVREEWVEQETSSCYIDMPLKKVMCSLDALPLFLLARCEDTDMQINQLSLFFLLSFILSLFLISWHSASCYRWLPLLLTLWTVSHSNEVQIMFKCSRRHFQTAVLLRKPSPTHTLMQTALSGLPSRAFHIRTAPLSLFCNE